MGSCKSYAQSVSNVRLHVLSPEFASLTVATDGAALFYTTPMPQTLQVLRQYALHLLFTPPAPSPGLAAEGAAPARNPFPFQHKANTLDRDHIVVPAGWDSWGKIAVLRDGFDAKAWGEAWENDIEPAEGEPEQPSAKKMYSSLVPDQGPRVSISIISSSPIAHEIHCSPLHCRPSTTLHPSKRSWRRTTTRTRRSRIAILVARSATPQRTPLLASSVRWAAAASACQMSSVRSQRWKAVLEALRPSE